jgi:hypothetical protein
LTVSARSASPVTPPPSGAFLLQLFQEGRKAPELLAQAPLHTIGPAPAPGQFGRTGPDATGRFSYAISLPVSAGTMPRAVRLRLTDPLGFQRELSAAVVVGPGGEES